MVIPDTFATHNADKQWGTVHVEKPVLELAYTASDNTQKYEKIKIFGVVEEPKSATWVHMTLTEPSGKTSQQKVIATSDGYYENFILICCNNIGKYSVYVEWRGYHIGTVTFDAIQKSTTQNPIVPTSTSKTSTLLTLNPLPSTFEIKDQNSPGVGITFSGKLTTSDRQYVITNAKIQLQDIRSGQTVQVTTDDNGKFNIKLNRAAGSSYAVNAVFDGSLNFESSKSQTEYFDVIPVLFPPQISPPQISPPTEDPGDNVGGAFLLVIIIVVVIVVIAIKKRKKRMPAIIQDSSGNWMQAVPESIKVSSKPTKVLPKPAKVSPKPAKVSPKPAKVSPKPAKVLPKKKKSHVNKSSSRFECKCGYHTCKKFYKTEKERKLHLAGVSAQKTIEKLQTSKDRLSKNEDQSQQNLLTICPKCGRQARTEKEIQGYFGYRMMKGVKHKQSWCRVCRTVKPDEIVKPKKNLLIREDCEWVIKYSKKIINQPLLRECSADFLECFETTKSIRKSIQKVIEKHPYQPNEKIRRHIPTQIRLPKKLQEKAFNLVPDEESSIKIALFATDYYQWDGDVRDEEKVIKFAMELAKGFEENNDLRLRLMGKKLH